MNFKPVVSALTLALAAVTAFATPVTYYGADNGVGPGGAHPNSTAALGAFSAAVGTTSLINFEGLAQSLNPTGVSVGPGTTLTVTGNVGGGLTTTGASVDYGYNTTAGGSEFLQMEPNFSSAGATATFNFASGVDAFGAYFTGTETAYPGAISVRFNDGSSESLSLTKTTSGGIVFFGFADPGADIVSIAISTGATNSSGRDFWGIDDVRFATTPASVPEPGTLFLVGAALLGLAQWSRKRARG